jgi:hypothetical protein
VTRRRWWSSFKVFWLAFLLLLLAGAALWVAQFRDNHAAPWISMGLAGAAVACTIGSLAVDR